MSEIANTPIELDLIRKVIDLKSMCSDFGTVGNWHRLFRLILHLFG